MTNPYITALNDQVYNGAQGAKAIDDSFEPFRRYLDNAQRALEKKEVSCEWQKIPSPNVVLSCKQSVFEIKPHTLVEFELMDEGWFEIIEDLDEEAPLSDDFDPDLSEPISIGRGKSRTKITLDSHEFKQESQRYYIKLGDCEESKISWTGYSLKIQPLSTSLPSQLELLQQGQPYQAKQVNGALYHLNNLPDANKTILFGDKKLTFKIMSDFSYPDNAINIDGCSYIVADKKPNIPNADIENITKTWLEQISLVNLLDENQNALPSDWSLSHNEGKLTLDTLDQTCPKTLRHKKLINLEIQCKKNTSDVNWIQLVSLDHGDDTGTSQDPLEYFFEDQIDILDQNEKANAKAGYRILKSRPEERQILLCRRNDGKRQAVLPKSKQLKVKVNTQALWRQREAITSLKLFPAIDQKPLLDLLKNRKQQRWPEFIPVDTDKLEWTVLTNTEFDGCDKQREFVTKTLATPDFAILDGPPGTGKTTTILELIIQLVRQGKRVLLTASTHAAINNVLERVDENHLNNEIFPLRIGDANRAVGVEHYQYDKFADTFSSSLNGNDYDQLLVDSSNLVCGTTMGILRLFNNKNLSFDTGESPFDVMIIDECSKTTFAEFLVPARYAKRWILVGDVKQLSPFTDREQITANLKQLVLKHKSRDRKEELLTAETQRACFLLSELRSLSQNNNCSREWGYHDKIIVPVTPLELIALQAEIAARSKNKNTQALFDSVCLVGLSTQLFGVNGLTQKQLQNAPWLLYEFNLLFCEEKLLLSAQNSMPADSVILDPKWSLSSHGFRHKARWDGTHHFTIKNGKPESNATNINSEWLRHNKETNWSEEVVWRLEREYWLRFLKVGTGRNGQNKAQGIRKQLDQLFPQSFNAIGRIYGIRNMAFPSVLEALSGSGTLKQKNDAENTLNIGFNNNEKQCRHTTLTYQHRMHPDISQYPRKQFYSDDNSQISLLDGRQTKTARDWQYNRYDKHAVWLDVNGNTHGNANEQEAKAIINELSAFCDWASQQDKKYSVGVLTFYKKQEKCLRDKLQALTGDRRSFARFNFKNVEIKLSTVDFFQGQEADLTFLSMVNTSRDGFLDSPNRLNVAITRARFQLVVVGQHAYYRNNSRSSELNALAQALPIRKIKG
ncbi:AAA domain-containing protein [Aliivibrio wodanis]|uniref:AAA domain-containing protein n=1 Tax=Aliivibrio wodanis TaxID=80852 RepID=UPI00406C8FC8